MTESVEPSVFLTEPQLPEAYRGITFNFELITPTWAAKILESWNAVNRKRSKKFVGRLCKDINAGQYLLTHQGIAFDTANNLIDGQHRLDAVVKTGISVWMVVSRGWPNTVLLSDGSSMPTYAALDVPGNARTIRTFLHSLGVENEREAASICLGFMALASGYRRIPTATNSIVKSVFDVVGPHINRIAELGKGPGIIKLPLTALWGFAWAHTVHAEAVEKLLNETIQAVGEEQSPSRKLAYALQNSRMTSGQAMRVKTCQLVSAAIQQATTGEKTERLVGGDATVRWLVNQNKPLRAQIASIMQVENGSPSAK